MNGKVKPKKRPRGRPEKPMPPKIDADAETIARATFAANDQKLPKQDRSK